MARKALVVGIDHYTEVPSLHGCVNDARAVRQVLEKHADGSANFAVKFMAGSGPADLVTRKQLKEQARQLFRDDEDTVLFYFAGHGHVEATGGYLVSSEAGGDDGLALAELLTYAHASKARNRIIVLDSCHSGIAGVPSPGLPGSMLTEGLTILTASTEQQYATEANGAGLFTSLFVEALNGAGANLVGEVSPGGVYAHIDQSLGPWEQRPVFKTNVKSFVSLRKVQPPVTLAELQRIVEFFPKAGADFALDPSFEPERSGNEPGTVPPPDDANTARFAVLQKFNRVNLVVPVNAPHMWHAAMQSKSCKLTPLGEHYRRLVERGRI
jgi:hypothetical protein